MRLAPVRGNWYLPDGRSGAVPAVYLSGDGLVEVLTAVGGRRVSSAMCERPTALPRQVVAASAVRTSSVVTSCDPRNMTLRPLRWALSSVSVTAFITIV